MPGAGEAGGGEAGAGAGVAGGGVAKTGAGVVSTGLSGAGVVGITGVPWVTGKGAGVKAGGVGGILEAQERKRTDINNDIIKTSPKENFLVLCP